MKDIEGIKGKERLEVEIGPARPEDARAIVELLYRSQLHTYPNEQFCITTRALKEYWKDEFTKEAVAFRAKKIENLAENISLLVARVNEDVVGLARIVRFKDHNYLGALYLHPDYIAKGLGMALWNRVREVCDKTKETRLYVAPYNERAKKFYESVGFVLEDKSLVYRPELTLPGGSIIPQQTMRRPAEVQSYV